MSTKLLIIDPQNDFCLPSASLYVPGAEQDAKRIAAFISKHSAEIDSIHITLDSHPNFHIAHPIFWVNKEGKNPPPYTVINYETFAAGIWMPVLGELKQRTEEYIMELETKGHYNLIIWPPHCLTASPGACVVDAIAHAAANWELEEPGRIVSYVTKTSNPFTEHYSAVQAEVPDKNDPTTRTNFEFIDSLKDADTIYICGEALSHCLSNTVRDLIAYIPPEKITILTDCTSDVEGYEKMGEDILKDFKLQGIKTAISTEI